MATQLATTDAPQVPQLSAQREAYAIMKDKAKMFAMSPLIPDGLRGNNYETACANCLIALELASLMNEAPLVVMQNIHIVKGKAGFSAQYMIARANASQVFKGRINWRMSGQGATLCAEAYATLAETGEEVSFAVDMAMAQAEGWTSNPKYKSVPHLMLRYRSATFLVRLYAPDVMLGYQTAEEVEDVYAGMAPSVAAQPLTAAMLTDQATGADTEEGPDQSQQGEANNGSAFDAAVGEIDRCPTADAIDSALARLRPMMETDEDADDLFSHAETVKARKWGGQ
ncbi:hypothetical protein VHN57_08360 [Sphingobium sp. WW5]|uniref:hypothetical protein n=1 Tax=unclassified Sphingobium TaxID=2611147 RepID=UPI003C13074F